MSWFSKLWGQPKPLNPADYDLRHFQWIHWSDAWDGYSAPVEGGYTRVLLYRSEVVRTVQSFFAHGQRETMNKTGNSDLEFIAVMGRVYLDVAQGARALAHPLPETPDVPLDVQVSKDTRDALLQHPQFCEMRDIFAGVGWMIRFVPAHHDPDLFRVICFNEP